MIKSKNTGGFGLPHYILKDANEKWVVNKKDKKKTVHQEPVVANNLNKENKRLFKRSDLLKVPENTESESYITHSELNTLNKVRDEYLNETPEPTPESIEDESSEDKSSEDSNSRII